MASFTTALTRYVTNGNITISNKGDCKNGEYYFKSFTVEEYDNL